MHEIDQ